jgi:hypothetical protein
MTFEQGMEPMTLPCTKTRGGRGASLSLPDQVKFNVNRVDNMVIQAIALLDTLDKDINTFVMRVREWYSWHFPELVKIVSDNYQYARLALFIKEKTSLTDDSLPGALLSGPRVGTLCDGFPEALPRFDGDCEERLLCRGTHCVTQASSRTILHYSHPAWMEPRNALRLPHIPSCLLAAQKPCMHRPVSACASPPSWAANS